MERHVETRHSSGGRQHSFARRLSTGLAGTIVIGGAIFMGSAASLVTAFANTGGVTVLETCTTWSVNAHLDNNVHNRLVTVTWPNSTFVINAIYTTDSPPVAVPSLFDAKGAWPATGTITLTIYLGPLISSGVEKAYTDFITPPEDCASPTISTKLSASSVTLPGTVTDQATLSGETNDAGGMVTYNVYAGSTASACDSVLQHNDKTVSSGSVPASDPFTLVAGSYEFQAVYSGDAKNKGAKSVCGTEPLTVQNQPALTTKLSATSVTLPGTVTDQATLSGETSDAGGMVTYNVYDVCGGSLLQHNDQTVSSGSVPASDPPFTLAAGSYEFQAVYSGDAKNKGAKSVCGTEPLTVTSAGAGGVLGITTTVPAATPSTPSTGATGSLTGITVGGFLVLAGLGLALVGAIVPRRRSGI
jgi:hypothetical protein